MRGEGPVPREDSDDAALLQKQGDNHEAAHLAKLKASGASVVEVARSDLAGNARETRLALAQGPQIVFQGALLDGSGAAGRFPRARPAPIRSWLLQLRGDRHQAQEAPHPKHVLQLVLYSDLLTKVQGIAPEFAHVELGDGSRARLRLADYQAYARMARRRLEDFLDDPVPTRPMPCADCALCRWGDHCESQWQAEDSLFNVANITRGQAKKLEAAGITTMEALAGLGHRFAAWRRTPACACDAGPPAACRKTGTPAFELRQPEPGKGFDLLPSPRPGDIFYDIEGDPHYEGGLEYLHGVWFDGQFKAFWAHDMLPRRAPVRPSGVLPAKARRIPRGAHPSLMPPTRSPPCGG